jgi:high-affinity nickel permease
MQRMNSELCLLGLCIVGFFAVFWLASFAIYHMRGYGHRQ